MGEKPCSVIALGVGIYDLLQVAFPEFTLNAYEYERHQSNDSFRNAPPVFRSVPRIAEAVPIPEATEDEITRQRRIATVACSDSNVDELAKVW